MAISKSDKFFTEREEEIIYEAIERGMRMIPEMVMQLVLRKETERKQFLEFIKANPEFAKNHKIVTGIIENHEADNPGLSYGERLKEVTPIIKSRLGSIKDMDVETVSKPTDLGFHGEI